VFRKFYITLAITIIGVVSLVMGIEILTYHHTSNEINYHTIIEMILLAILRFLINSVWGVYFVFVSELYPAEVSSLSYGWVSVIGTVGACIAPYIRLATANMTMFIIAILCGVTIFLVRLLE
jgi:MFS family permease